MDFLKKKDFLYPFFGCIILFLAILPNYYSFGNLLYDCGREFLVPKAVMEGELPVKEIFLSYFPLSYQINALLFKIFSSSFDTLRITGVFSSFIIVIFIYHISRFFTDEKKSFLISIIVPFITMFNVSYLFNYVMGYSYAFIYASAILFISVYFVLLYLKENKTLFLYLSYFLLGICFALKIEFIFLIVPYFLLVLYKKIKIKEVIISFLLFLLPVFISFFILFVGGFNFYDFISYIEFLKSFLNSKILKYYNSTVFVSNPILWIKYNLSSFLSFIIPFLLCGLILYFPVKKEKEILYRILFVFLFVLFFVLSIVKGEFCSIELFSFLCITTLFIVYHSYKTKNIPLLFLSLVQLFLCMRFNFIYTGNYSAYILPAGLVVNLIFLSSIVKNKVFNKLFLSFMILTALVNVIYYSTSQVLFSRYEIKTNKGKFLISDAKTGFTIKETINFLDKLKDKKVLILPDGAMLNYLSDTKTDLRYYQLLPNHIEILGEEKIVNDLNNDKPDYIMLTNVDYSIYGTPLFCRDFGNKICNFVFENYDYIKTFANDKNFVIGVYKVKK